MYGKHFASMYTGSMYGAGADLFAVWGFVIAHVQRGEVELNPKKMADHLGMPLENVQAALKVLMSPDPASRTKEHEGRRLLPSGEDEYTFLVPTHLKYRDTRNEEERREYNRVKKAESRRRAAAGQGMSSHESMTVSPDSTASASASGSSVAFAVEGGVGETSRPSTKDTRHRSRPCDKYFAEPQHLAAYRAYKATHRMPDALDAGVYVVFNPITGGAQYTWPIIGQALLEMRAAQAGFSTATLRAFCRRLTQPEMPPGRPNAKGYDKMAASRANIDAWVLEKEAEERANAEKATDEAEVLEITEVYDTLVEKMSNGVEQDDL